jgi:glycosyltransferase involved in cell wall biosynthesis
MQKILRQKLSRSKVVIASHIFADGPAIFLEQYLTGKVASLLFIGHPFAGRKQLNSFCRMSTNGENSYTTNAPPLNLPQGLMQIKEAILTLWWAISMKGKIDIYIGSDNFMAYLGLVLKSMGKVNEVIFYTIDYVPKRFTNPLMNFLYHYFDRQCLKKCKIVWNVSEKIASAREEFDKLSISKTVPQIVVPLGIWYDRIPRIPYTKREKATIVFMGHIRENQGLDIVIKSLQYITKKIRNIKLVVIGTGPLENNMKKMVQKLKLGNQVTFMEYIEDHTLLESILAKSTIGVAIYKPTPENFTYYADPGKVKNYLGAGLPVFITDVPAIAKVIVKKKCAVMCEYDEHDIAEKITKLLSNQKKLMAYTLNAAQYSKQFDWNKVFSDAFNKTFS